MPSEPLNEAMFAALQKFVARDVFQRGTTPLKNGTELNIHLNLTGPVTLTRRDGKTLVLPSPATKPDMTYWVAEAALTELGNNPTEDIGEMGVALLKLMANPDPTHKITVKVHVGLFDFLTHGYLGILPLGGATVMKHLSSMGLTGIGKIKDAISRLKD